MLSRSRLLTLCAAIAALAAGAGRPASAQQATSELESWRVPGWSFTPGVAIGGSFDSNVAIAGPDQFGNTISDRLIEIEPMGQLEFFSPRTSLSSGYRGSWRRYFELSDLDGVDHRLYLTLRHRLNRRVSIYVDDNFRQAPTTDALELNGLPFVRTGSRHNMFGTGVDARLTRSLDLSSRYEMTFVDFLSDPVPLTGALVQGVTVGLTHRFGARLSAGGEYGIRRADLNDRSHQYLFQNVGGVLQYRTGEHTTLDLSGGATYLIDQSRDLTRTGPYLKASLVHRVARATLGGEYQRSYVPSFTFGGIQRSHVLRGYIDMPFSRNRFYVQESAAWRRTDPLAVDEVALASSWVRSTLGYAIRRWVRLEAHHTFSTQNNRLAGGKVTRHVAGLQLVISEPMRIR